MWKYSVGLQICCYVLAVWDKQAFLLQQTGFYSKPLLVDRGVTQDNVDLPIIFNLIVDVDLHHL